MTGASGDLQSLYGLVVSSQFPLHQQRGVAPGTPVDVHVRWGEPISAEVQSRPVAGTVLLEARWDDDDVGYFFVERPDGRCLLRFNGTCDFDISPDLSQVTVSTVDGADPGIAVVLTTGAMLAFQLYRRGLAVLHASAVEIDGRAVAFVADSGGGKSTMATLMCAAGARLITDDVLRIDTEGDVPVVRSGATELRLRKGADTLAELFATDAPDRRISADQRQILSPRADAPDRLPLAAIVLPFPDHDRDSLLLEKRGSKEALFGLLSFPRLLGWKDPAVLRTHLAHLSALVAKVPVYTAEVPWGPPFSPDIAPELWAAVSARSGRPTPSGTAQSLRSGR